MNLIHRLQDPDNPNSFVSRFRRRRSKYIRDLIETIFAETGRCRIIDLGGREDYWRLFERAFLESRKVHITLVNLEEMPATADPMFTLVAGSACDLAQFNDGAFDLVHSNSVVEHVGDWDNVERFARETRRLAKRYYVQTPHMYFPVEPHFSALFFHWLPESMRADILIRRKLGFMPGKAADMGEAMRAVQHARLLSKRMFRYLFEDAEHRDERFAGLTKSLIAIRA